jgi:hypothetical protein
VTEFDKVIRPGGVGKVTASLDTSHYTGLITKSVQVRSNEPGVPPLVLLLKARIVSLIEVAPSDTPVLRSTVADPKTVELTLSAGDGKPFDVVAVKADPSVAVTVRLPPGTPVVARRLRRGQTPPVAAGSSRYLVTIAPTEEAPVGSSVANVALSTNRARAETLSIRTMLFVAGLVQVVPPQIFVRPGPDAPALHVKVLKPGGGLQILGVESADPEFSATTTAIEEGREYDLAVTYSGKPGRGPINSRLTLRTNEPRQGTIVIPLTGRL